MKHRKSRYRVVFSNKSMMNITAYSQEDAQKKAEKFLQSYEELDTKVEKVELVNE